jgi:nucleotide-binding universal stress UspA family protein
VDLGIVFGLSGILIAIFVATIVFVWQATSVSNRFDAGLQDQGERLGAEIRAQGERLEAEIRAQGQRVSDVELEQARLNGVNSVVIGQAHTHETLAD